jgi:2-phosphoglycolate phosphatase
MSSQSHAGPVGALRFKAVLFDLDGTLVDSAPDLAGAGNELRQAHGLAPLPFERFRPMVGTGARGMVGIALDVGPAEARFAALRDDFLMRYERRMTRETRVFAEMQLVIDAFSTRGQRWGIVTNKASRFAVPLVRALGLDVQVSTLVCGDTTPHAKPHPAPLLEAARQMAVRPEDCVYVGDDLRDIQAGLAAGMVTIAAAWGYLGESEPIDDWGAHHVVKTPKGLLKLLAMA